VAETNVLSEILRDAVGGRFPPPDGTVRVLPSPPGRSDAVVSFTAHNVIAAGLDQGEILPRLPSQDPGAPMSPEFLAWLAERLGTRAGMLDLVMVAPVPDPGEDLPELVPRDEFLDHPRLAVSRRYRTDLRFYSDLEDRAIVVLGKGLATRWEMGIEVKPEFRGGGLGKLLVRAAGRVAPAGEPLFAQVSPGNVASVRAFLAAGYKPICSEVVFLRTRPGLERPGSGQVTRIPK
jgi:GNAT superfamily N-acetyltransferase